jgi:hypothetical protein
MDHTKKGVPCRRRSCVYFGRKLILKQWTPIGKSELVLIVLEGATRAVVDPDASYRKLFYGVVFSSGRRPAIIGGIGASRTRVERLDASPDPGQTFLTGHVLRPPGQRSRGVLWPGPGHAPGPGNDGPPPAGRLRLPSRSPVVVPPGADAGLEPGNAKRGRRSCSAMIRLAMTGMKG